MEQKITQQDLEKLSMEVELSQSESPETYIDDEITEGWLMCHPEEV